MITIEELHELELKQGEVHEARFPIASLPDGTEVFIPVIVGEGIESGPTLLLTALIHGIEVGGYDTIRRLMYEEVNFSKVRGRIIAVPIVNPFAFSVANRFTPQDSVDLNRVFPGNKNGTLSQRIAYMLTKKIVKHADYVIDFHSCNPPSEFFTIVDSGGNDRVRETSWQIAEAFGVITVSPSIAVAGTFSGYLSSIGKPSITPELTFSRRFDESSELAVQGIINVMSHLSMIDVKTQEIMNALAFTKRFKYIVYHADKGGFVHFNKNVGENIKEGDVFITIKNPFGEAIEEVRSSVDGIIIAYPMAGNQAVTTGDKLAYIAYL